MQTDKHGRRMTREALVHRERNRFRCVCKADFCGICRVVPYHLGFTCEDWLKWKQQPVCLFCEDKADTGDAFIVASNLSGCEGLSWDEQLSRAVSSWPMRNLRANLAAFGLEKSSALDEGCIERRDLEAVLLFAARRVCEGKSCRLRLAGCCLKTLSCGHRCMGCAGERGCGPCFECLSGESTASSSYCPCCGEAVPPGPTITLECKHLVHAHCLARQLGVPEAGQPKAWKPPSQGALSFDFRNCPACRARIGDLQWPRDIAQALQRASELEVEVASTAVKRLKTDPHHRRDDALRPGGTFDGQPRKYALSLYQYHLCEGCDKPYFGGERRCAPAQGGGGAARGGVAGAGEGDAEIGRRLCGGCAALKAGKTCPKGHDPSLIEWKCEYCCSLAAWFCWGTTHMCDPCHENQARREVTCLGAGRCPWAGKHPKNGSKEAFCLGCSLCRHAVST